jgi:hypothetical protein
MKPETITDDALAVRHEWCLTGAGANRDATVFDVAVELHRLTERRLDPPYDGEYEMIKDELLGRHEMRFRREGGQLIPVVRK